MGVRVLVVGASGRLGAPIVRELVARGATVRAGQRTAVAAPEGVEAVQLDLGDEASLRRACDGVDVVVSVVQGLGAMIVDGQARLVRAAEDAGVRRFVPSDFSIDFFRTVEGQNRNLDLRREFGRLLDASRVRGTSVLCGALMDLLRGPLGPGPTGAITYWGDPDQPRDYTSIADVARYVAAVALDADAGRVVRVAGDTRSARELAAIFAEVRGVPVPLQRAGSLEELDATITRLRDADPAPDNTFPVWQQLQYARDMASGRGKLDPLDNARYPDIHPQGVRAFLSAPG